MKTINEGFLSIRDRQKTTFIVSQGEKSFISRRFFLAEGDKTICCGKIVKQQVDLLDFYRLFFWLTLKEHKMFKRILIAFITVCSFAMADPIDNLDKYRIYTRSTSKTPKQIDSNSLKSNKKTRLILS